MASVPMAYFLWQFLGIFGVHHFYLRRDRQAFVWWCTLGGVFGLGWLRDFWQLPRYVQEANEEKNGANVQKTAQGKLRPRFGWCRMAGMVVMGCVLGYLVVSCFPVMLYEMLGYNRQLHDAICILSVVLAVALGVHTVASIGRVRASFKSCLVGSGLMILALLVCPREYSIHVTPAIFIVLQSSLSTLTAFAWGLSWKVVQRPQRGLCWRLFTLTLCGSLYLSAVGMCLNDVTISTRYRYRVPLREAVEDFFRSSTWMETRESGRVIWEQVVNVCRNTWVYLELGTDPPEETDPYKILGLYESCTLEELKTKYRDLVKRWHPDKQYDSSRKQWASKKFMSIQWAYERLLTVKSRRWNNNRKSRDEF